VRSLSGSPSPLERSPTVCAYLDFLSDLNITALLASGPRSTTPWRSSAHENRPSLTLPREPIHLLCLTPTDLILSTRGPPRTFPQFHRSYPVQDLPTTPYAAERHFTFFIFPFFSLYSLFHSLWPLDRAPSLFVLVFLTIAAPPRSSLPSLFLSLFVLGSRRSRSHSFLDTISHDRYARHTLSLGGSYHNLSRLCHTAPLPLLVSLSSFSSQPPLSARYINPHVPSQLGSREQSPFLFSSHRRSLSPFRSLLCISLCPISVRSLPSDKASVQPRFYLSLPLAVPVLFVNVCSRSPLWSLSRPRQPISTSRSHLDTTLPFDLRRSVLSWTI
jgi:hypothetical protein